MIYKLKSLLLNSFRFIDVGSSMGVPNDIIVQIDVKGLKSRQLDIRQSLLERTSNGPQLSLGFLVNSEIPVQVE